MRIDPESTVLLFGVGTTIPSEAPSLARIFEDLSDIINESSQWSARIK